MRPYGVAGKTTATMQDAARRVKMPLEQYFDKSIERGLTQQEMAIELKVSRLTVMRWLRDAGYRPVITYVREAA